MSRLLSAFLLLLLGAAPVTAQETIINNTYNPKTGTKAVVTALISELPTSGYLPIRVSLRNGGKIDRTWSFRFTSYDSGYAAEPNEMRSDFTGRCAKGQAASYEFLVPLVSTFQQDYSPTTELDIQVSATAYPSINQNMSTDYEASWPSVMMSSSLYKKNAGPLDAEAQAHVSSTTGGSSSGGSLRFAGDFDPKQMSDQWLAYSGYDYCFITGDEWRTLSPGARGALLQWNRMGGSLLICGSDASLDLKALGVPGPPAGVRESNRSWGTIKLLSIPSSGNLEPKKAVQLITTDIPKVKGQNRLSSLRSDYSSNWPLHLSFGSKTAHIIFFILVLIAFGVLVGPINLFVFAKAGQRHRLFITTPIISIGASLLLILLIVFQDGFGGRGQRLILMEVRSDNSENSAFLSQEQIARTGVLFSTSFTTSDPAYISPVLISESRWARVTQSNDGGNSRYQADVLENGLKVAGDWFQSRSEHGHLLETIRPTRGRIEIVSTPPNPVIISTFEFPLEKLYFIDPDGDHWMATDVAQGRKTELSPVPETQFNAWATEELDLFSPRNQRRLTMTTNRTGHFVATSDEVDGIGTLDSISWKETHAVITGPVFAP